MLIWKKQAIMQKLEPPDSHYLNAAQGWMELGLPAEAAAELEQISPALQRHPDVLETRCFLQIREDQWDAVLDTARKLVSTAPTRVSGWLNQASALRRVPSGGAAQALAALMPAADKFPKDPTVAYNLSCYACLTKRYDEARFWFRRALKTGNKEQVKRMALADPDLSPLWPEIRKLG